MLKILVDGGSPDTHFGGDICQIQASRTDLGHYALGGLEDLMTGPGLVGFDVGGSNARHGCIIALLGPEGALGGPEPDNLRA
jgi:hypothetical protein